MLESSLHLLHGLWSTRRRLHRAVELRRRLQQRHDKRHQSIQKAPVNQQRHDKRYQSSATRPRKHSRKAMPNPAPGGISCAPLERRRLRWRGKRMPLYATVCHLVCHCLDTGAGKAPASRECSCEHTARRRWRDSGVSPGRKRDRGSAI